VRLRTAALAAFAANASPGLSAVGALRFPGIVRRAPDAAGLVALTFDDGPHAQGTPAVLEQLDRHGLRATFYLVGRDVRRAPGLAAEVVAAGHEVGLHGDRHMPHPLLPPPLVLRDLARGLAAVEAAAGRPPRSVRAPFGAASLGTLAFARRHGLPLVSWTRWGRDWEPRADAAAIAARLSRGLGPGDILLLHDSDAYSARRSWRATAGAVPLLAEALAKRGLVSAPVSELLAVAAAASPVNPARLP
jgi:peptidoglycan-N-acetylglucosamine deacetylase